MNVFLDAIAWIFSPDRLTGFDPLPERLVQHLGYTFAALGVTALIAIPLGYYIGHTGRGRNIAIALAGAARALPSFGLILLLVLLIGVTQRASAAIIAFVLLGIPSLLAGAYAGIEAVDRRTVDAARAMGMTEWQILWKVEIPLGLPLLIGGLRGATLQIVATATLAGYIGLGSLGIYIFNGLNTRDTPEVIGGAIVVAVVAVVLDAVFALIERLVVPRGVVAGRAPDPRASSPRRRAVTGTPVAQREG